jgi:hypothetical protein
MSRVVGQSAAIQAAIRQHYYEQPRSSRIIAPPIAPVVIPVAFMSMVEGAEQFWHVRGDHHDPIVLVTDGVSLASSSWSSSSVRGPRSSSSSGDRSRDLGPSS